MTCHSLHSLLLWSTPWAQNSWQFSRLAYLNRFFCFSEDFIHHLCNFCCQTIIVKGLTLEPLEATLTKDFSCCATTEIIFVIYFVIWVPIEYTDLSWFFMSVILLRSDFTTLLIFSIPSKTCRCYHLKTQSTTHRYPALSHL